ncbi:sugar transporter SWEET1 isoform X2 [Hemicordylus capensis]|nr:sugar transporter SWEET1 isoform X2 [Hemicordylus capensis]
MYTARSVENIQFLPFLTTDINNLSWLSYGFLKGDWTLIIVNAIGATLQTLYVLVYFYFSPEKRSVLLKTLALLAVLLLGYCYFNMLVQDVTLRLARLGLFCSLFTISMYLSPLADLVGDDLALVFRRMDSNQGQDREDAVHAMPFLSSDRYNLLGFSQLDAVWASASRPLYRGPQRARHRHQHGPVLAFLALPRPRQSLQAAAGLRPRGWPSTALETA